MQNFAQVVMTHPMLFFQVLMIVFLFRNVVKVLLADAVLL